MPDMGKRSYRGIYNALQTCASGFFLGVFRFSSHSKFECSVLVNIECSVGYGKRQQAPTSFTLCAKIVINVGVSESYCKRFETFTKESDVCISVPASCVSRL